MGNDARVTRVAELELAGHNAPNAESARRAITALIMLAMDAGDMAVEQYALQAAGSIAARWEVA